MSRLTGALPLPLGTLSPHPDAARRLRHALLSNGYDAEALAHPLRLRTIAGASHHALDWRDMAGNDSPLTTLIELFGLGHAVERARAEAALAPLSLPDAVRAGFVQLDGERVISPWELLVEHDLFLLGDHPDRMTEGNVDFVGPVSNSARTLAYYTARTPVADALDLGTGSGIQALLAARHSGRVLGVDLNPRAASIAGVNGSLNELFNLEYRLGDWFEAVDPERVFGLVVANLPFLAAPQVVFRFAHGGLDPNELSRKIVRGAAERIADGGFAQILTTWTRGVDEDRMGAVRGFVEGTGCDALVLAHGYDEPQGYAAEQAGWMASHDEKRYGELLAQWLHYYRRTGADAIEYGLISLRRSVTGRPWLRAIDVPRMYSGQRGDHVERMFAGNDYAESLSGDDELLSGCFRLLDEHRVTQSSRHEAGGYQQEPTEIELTPDRGYTATVAPEASAVLFSMSDAERLGESVARVAADLGVEEAPLRHTTARAVEDLLRRGMALPVG